MKIININAVSKSDLFRYIDLLQSTEGGYKTIESFMSNYYGITWSMYTSGIQICNYLKSTMYFDSDLNMWLEK